MSRRIPNPRPKSKNFSTPARVDTSLASHQAIVTHYLANYSGNANRELRFYRNQRSYSEALEHAALARLASGKRAHHQRRIPASVLNAARDALENCDLQSCKTFHDLICLIDETVRSIHSIGELYVYDTALRIGAFLRLQPDRVYIHAGVRVGARALGFIGGDPIFVSEIPEAFRDLPAHQIEDCLCIYKRELVALGYKG